MTRVNTDTTLLKARSHANKGEIIEAQKLYQSILETFPKNIRAQRELALLNVINKKSQVSPSPQSKVNSIIRLFRSGQISTLLKEAETFLEEYPDSAIVWNIYGVSAAKKQMLDKAIDAFKKSIAFDPKYAEAYYNLGNTLHDLYKFDDAIEAFKKCIFLKPAYADAHYNMGIALQDQGNLDEALFAYKNCILLNSNFVDGYVNLGNVLKSQGKLNEALEYFKKAILLKPNYDITYNNIGNIFRDQGKYTLAIRAFKKAIKINPDYAEAYNNMGNAFREEGKLIKAIKAFEKARLIKPNYDSATAQKLFQQANICDWELTEEDKNLIHYLGTKNRFVPPFIMLCLEDVPKNHRVRSEVFAKANFPQKPLPSPTIPIKKPDRIRIGYFSADFHNHATMCLMSKVFAIHNRQKFKIYAYSYGPEKKDQMRLKVIRSVDVFDDVSKMTDKDIAKLARQDKIDIAVDLKGLTKDQRLGIFAYRAAPIQISYLGYPGTTGTNFIDYIIADPIVLPVNQKRFYSEKIIYLPNTYQPNDNTRVISSKVTTRKDMELPENCFVFCCFNNNYKITSVEFDIWMRLLSKVKGSVLWLLKSNVWAEENLKKEAEKRGIKKNRLIFAENLPHDEHLARHRHADLFIDTFKVNAHTTASDALWAGLPVVTKLGKGFASRVAGSLLSALDMSELITNNDIEYETLILELASNPRKLNQIRQKLLNNKLSKPLFNSELFTKFLEYGYQEVFSNYYNEKRPQDIIINKAIYT